MRLHAVGERAVSVVDRAEIDDKVRLGGDQPFEIERIAAARQPSKLRQVANAGSRNGFSASRGGARTQPIMDCVART